MRKIENLVVHCAYTPEGKNFTIDDIKRWHVEERGWSDIGYHVVIHLDGTVHQGRPDEVIGAGVFGHNKNSIHLCYIGGMDADIKEPKDTRNQQQKESLRFMLQFYKNLYPIASIKGHRDFKGVTKECPCFDAQSEYKDIISQYEF